MLKGTTTGASEPVRFLSPSDYHSLAAQAKEDAAIWTRTWVGLGFAADIGQAGDILPATVGNHGVHVERCADGSLVGRFNKAQHGGCRAVPLQCQTGAKTKCSFTACGYSRDRRPIAASDPDRLLQLDQYLGLRPERLLTVPVRPHGPLIAAMLDPMRTAPLDWPEVGRGLSDAGGETRWIEFAANWKHLMVAFGSADGEVRAELLYPNVVVLSALIGSCAIILHPTALGRTLCRVRRFRSDAATPQTTSSCDLDDILEIAAKRAACAEAWQDDPSRTCAIDPVRTWFERKVRAAFDELDDEERLGVLYQTSDKGEWR